MISDGSSVSSGKITVVNMTEIERPRVHTITTVDLDKFVDYNNPHWVNDNAFIVGRTIVDSITTYLILASYCNAII